MHTALSNITASHLTSSSSSSINAANLHNNSQVNLNYVLILSVYSYFMSPAMLSDSFCDYYMNTPFTYLEITYGFLFLPEINKYCKRMYACCK